MTMPTPSWAASWMPARTFLQSGLSKVVNVLLGAERRGYISEADSVRFISLLSQLPIQVQYEGPGKGMKDLLALARAHSLSSYDASYLDLAMKSGLPLATLDKKLRLAAKAVRLRIF